MKKSIFIALAIFTVSYAPINARANDNQEAPSIQEACENLANEDTSGADWGTVFDECVSENGSHAIEDTTWEITPTDDGDEPYVEDDEQNYDLD